MKREMKGTLSNGESFWVEINESGEWIFFEDEKGTCDEFNPQTMPRDKMDYRYTHGGRLYREACDLFWAEERRDKI